ncbi:MAG TPA: hypothetical protein VJY39_18400, partial [Acidisphaera sp.]|nr:hypothetical protein [Acidisphaera sp.]
MKPAACWPTGHGHAPVPAAAMPRDSERMAKASTQTRMMVPRDGVRSGAGCGCGSPGAVVAG